MGWRWSARDVAGVGAIIGSMMALGYALSGIPNVELVTLTAFIGGWLLGTARGALAGALGMFLFSLFNPLGPALPPVHAAQTAGMALAGAAGGWMRRVVPGPWRMPRRRMTLVLGGIGALLTVTYDVLTNAGSAVAMHLVSEMPKVIAAGVAFSALHIVTNTALFAVLGPAALFVVEKRRAA